MVVSIETDRVALEAQLHSSVRLQIENTRDGLNELALGGDRLGVAKDHLQSAVASCRQADGLISNFPFIRAVSRLHARLAETGRIYAEFEVIGERIERTAALLEADLASPVPRNLLLVYLLLSRLREFRAQSLRSLPNPGNANQNSPVASSSSSTVTFALRRHFGRLDEVERQFEGWFWALPAKLYGWALQGERAALVAVAKVLWRMERGERSRFLALLGDWVAKSFQAAQAGWPPGGAWSDPEACLGPLAWWRAQLLVIRDVLAPAFPPDLALFDHLLLLYHRHLQAAFMACCQPPAGQQLQPADLLYLLGWAAAYRSDLQSHLGVSLEEELEPPLLEAGLEARLIASYIAQSREQLQKWIGNLGAKEEEDFCQRKRAPELDAANHYYSPAAVDLIQILRQQVTTATGASRGRLALEIIGDVSQAALDLQDRLKRLMASEWQRCREHPEQAPGNLEDHVIKLGNTALRWATGLKGELIDRLGELVDGEYQAAAAKPLRAASDGFLEVARQACSLLVDICFAPLMPVILKLFTSAWYTADGLVQACMATFDDFFRDFQQRADDFLFQRIVAEAIDRWLLTYLTQLRAKTSKLKMQEAPRRLKEDLNWASACFTRWREERRVVKSLDALDKWISLITASRKIILLEWYAFGKVYPDAPLALLEETLLRRDDLDKASVKEIIEACQRKRQEERQLNNSDPTATTIYSRINLK